MAELIARSRRYDIAASASVRPLDALAESIAYQQLSGKAAAKIWSRVRALYPRKYLDPNLLLATPDEQLRTAGLSRSKIAALKDLASKTIDGTVPSARALSRMRDHRASHDGTRHRPVDCGDAPSFRSWPARCVAGPRLRRPKRFRENFSPKKIADAKTAPEIRRKMAAVPLSGRMVFLARIGWAGKKSRGLKVCDVTLGLPSKLS